jgi:general secretion pathway protein M
MTRIAAWLRRLTAVVLLAIVMAAAYLIGLAPLVAAYRDNAADLQDAREQLSRYGSLSATESQLQDKLRQVAEWEALQSYHLNHETEALAGVELQNRVSDAVAANSGTIRSLQPLPGARDSDFQRITLRVLITTTIESLFRILYTLETGQPFLFIDNVDIKSNSTRTASQEKPSEPVLTVAFDLYGFRPLEGP